MLCFKKLIYFEKFTKINPIALCYVIEKCLPL